MALHSSQFKYARLARTIPLVSTQKYDGSTGYFNGTGTWTNNYWTAVFLMKRASFTGDTWEHLIRSDNTGSGQRIFTRVYSSDYTSDTALKNKMEVRACNSAGTIIWDIVTESVICDDAYHAILAAFDATTGEAVLKVDGFNEDDTGWANRVAPTTDTMVTASAGIGIGGSSTGGFLYAGELGHIGYADLFVTDWNAFFYPGNIPRAIDETTWTEWGSQPAYWHPCGDFRDNLGSRADPTKNGVIVPGVARPLLVGWEDV